MALPLARAAHAAPPLQPPPVHVEILELQYDAVTDQLKVRLALSPPSAFRSLIFTVQESGGVDLYSDDRATTGSPTFSGVLSTEGLRAGQEYVLRVSARDVNNNFLERGEGGLNSDERTVLATRAFPYTPYQAPDVAFKIRSHTVDYAAAQLRFDLEVSAVEQQLRYEGVITSEGSALVQQFSGRIEEANPSVTLTLPEAMRRPGLRQEFFLSLSLFDSRGQRFDEEPFAFTPAPPPRVGLLQRLGQAIRQNLILPLTMVVILGSLIGWRYLANKPRRTFIGTPAPTPLTPGRPPIQQTKQDPPNYRVTPPRGGSRGSQPHPDYGVPSSPPAREPQRPAAALPPAAAELHWGVRVRVVSAPFPHRQTWNLERFPYDLGRQQIFLNEAEADRQVSRLHLVVEVRGGRLLLTDKSTYGTSAAGETMIPNKPTPFSAPIQVQLGPRTCCELFLVTVPLQGHAADTIEG